MLRCRAQHRKVLLLIVLTLVLLVGLSRRRSRVSKYVDTSRLTATVIREKKFQVGDTKPSNLTVVTLVFPAPNDHDYRKLAENFFASVTSVPVIVFTEARIAEEIIRIAYNYKNSKTFYVYRTVWEVVTLIEMARKVNQHQYVTNYIDVQPTLDPRSNDQSPYLYAVQNSKPFLMRKASMPRYNTFKSKLFIYAQIDSFKDRVFSNWPNSELLLRINDKLKNRVILNRDPRQPGAISANFLAGGPKVLRFLSQKFYDLHDKMMTNNEFVGNSNKTLSQRPCGSVRQYMCP